jgi:AAA15 family ATPase/GTPase
MILEFKVRNYLSIKEEQVLSFEATSDNTLEDVFIAEKGKFRVLKTAMFFGPNASGKSNILSSLNFLRQFTIKVTQTKDDETGHVPYLLDTESRNQHGFMELSFFVHSLLHVYTVEINHSFVSSEKLSFYPGVKPALIFHRKYNQKKDISEIEFGSTIKVLTAEKSMLQAATLRNMSVIAAFSKVNMEFPELDGVYNYFKNKMVPLINPKSILRSWSNQKVGKSEDTRRFALKMVQNADYSIQNIQVENIKQTLTPDLVKKLELTGLSDEEKTTILSENQLAVSVLSFTRGIQNSEAMSFPSDMESAGTNRLFDLSVVLYQAITENDFLMIDELDNSLHPDLFNHFIKTFLVNSKEAQLIFTTHNINILSEQDSLRKDVIWFTQKSNAGATELYSMADFSHRKELSFINAYKAGKFGAKPKLGSIYMEE